MGESRMKDVLVSRVFDAPRARMWKPWTDPEDVKRWWGPGNFTVPVVKIDLRVGGSFLYCMRGSQRPVHRRPVVAGASRSWPSPGGWRAVSMRCGGTAETLTARECAG
jgi:uncharacterized protein YndB with AHSA1/START domain